MANPKKKKKKKNPSFTPSQHHEKHKKTLNGIKEINLQINHVFGKYTQVLDGMKKQVSSYLHIHQA